MQTKAIIKYISDWLLEYIEKSKNKGFVIGVSGGIDSAVTSTIVAKTNKPVICLNMSIYQESTQEKRGINHINWLKSNYQNVSLLDLNLNQSFDALKNNILEKVKKDELAIANLKARLRMLTLYYVAQTHNSLVVGTGNKVEDFGIGFFTKYGDGGVDISPIADLLKSDVYLLAKELGIDKEIIQAPPTDGLWIDNKTDEEQIGATYAELEWAMNFSGDEKLLDSRQKEVIKIYTKFNKKTKHKMIPIPVCKIPKDLL